MVLIVKTILDNRKYASVELTKLAIAYRFLESNTDSEVYQEKFMSEKLKIISTIVKTMKFETNLCLKCSVFNYSKTELKTKIMDRYNTKNELCL